MYIHIYHEQECKAGSSFAKSFNVIHHINKLKGKNMICQQRKKFDKI